MVTKLWVVVGVLAVIFVFTTLWAVRMQSARRDGTPTTQAVDRAEDLKQFRARMEQLRVFPPSVWEIMQTADAYLAVSINPGTRHSSEFEPTTQKTLVPLDTPRELHGYSVIGSVAITDADTRSRLNQAVRSGIEQWDGAVSACTFQPRHAIRLIRGQRVVDILICYHCGDVFIYDAASGKEDRRYIVRGPPPVFDEVFRAANIPVAAD